MAVVKHAAIVALIAAAFASSCSPTKTETPGATAPAAAKPAPQNPTFDLLSAWSAKRVVIKTMSGGEPSMSYTITPKNAPSFVALELAMTQDAAAPISANYSKLVLIDAAGGRRDPVFTYPSDATSYEDDKETITFSDDPGKLINGKLNEMGGKLISVFEAPADTAGLKVEIAGAPAVDVALSH